MKDAWIVAADSVHLYANRLVIVGVFDRVILSALPGAMPPMGFGVRTIVEEGDLGKTYAYSIQLRQKGSTEPIFGAEGTIHVTEHSSGEIETFQTGFQIGPLPVQVAGVYEAVFAVEGEELCKTEFEVVVKAKPSDSKAITAPPEALPQPEAETQAEEKD